MKRISGTGCMSSCVLGAFLAANPEDPVGAIHAACEFVGECGEKAAARTEEINGGTMTFRLKLIDELSRSDN